MTIDEAIDTLQTILDTNAYDEHSSDPDAVKLGIEALKWIKRDQDRCMPGTVNLLPGQTKE